MSQVLVIKYRQNLIKTNFVGWRVAGILITLEYTEVFVISPPLLHIEDYVIINSIIH